jgi:hypothetical protein
MAQFSNVSYGSQFKPYASTNSQSYGAGPYKGYSQLAALMAGGGQPGANTQGMGGAQGYFTLNPYDATVSPSNQVTSANAPATSWNPSQGVTMPGGGPSINDLSTDPILQQIQAAGLQAVQDARSAAMRNAENEIIGYGSTDVPASIRSAYSADPTDPILAALTDAATGKAAQANPDSTLMRLANQNTQNTAKENQGLNSANLFYSSTRGNDLGQLANTYRSAQNDAAATLASMLGGQEGNVLNAQAQAQANYLNALQGAWDRWMSMNPSGSGAGPISSQLAANNIYGLANQVQAGQVPAAALNQYIDPNSAAGRYAQSVAQQQAALANKYY